MKSMRSINLCLAAALLAGCMPAKYGQETQLTLQDGTHPVWAIAPAINLSGETSVDPVLQADLVFQQLQAVNNVTVIPVNRVVEVYAALHITKVESEDQAAIVCEQLGCDALVVPTITVYDPYNPPKLGAAVQIFRRHMAASNNNISARDLARLATPTEDQTLPAHPQFTQAVGMYDSANGFGSRSGASLCGWSQRSCGPHGIKRIFYQHGSLLRVCLLHAYRADAAWRKRPTPWKHPRR